MNLNMELKSTQGSKENEEHVALKKKVEMTRLDNRSGDSLEVKEISSSTKITNPSSEESKREIFAEVKIYLSGRFPNEQILTEIDNLYKKCPRILILNYPKKKFKNHQQKKPVLNKYYIKVKFLFSLKI